jgi:hypothetical protein
MSWTRRDRIVFAVWLAAAAFVVILYVGWNTPLAMMASRLAPVGFALMFVLSYAGLGSVIVRWLLPDQDELDQLLVAIAFGLGLTGLLVFGLGLAGILDPAIYAVWTVGGLALFGLNARRFIGSLAPRSGASGTLTVLAIVILVVTIVQVVPYLVAPPVATDELEYHLLIPKLYLEMGKIANIPLLCEASYPSLAEYLFTPVLAIAGDVACKALHFWLGLCGLVAMGRLVARVRPAGDRLLAPALFVSMPLVSPIFAAAWNDGLFVALLVIAFGLLLDYHSGRHRAGDDDARPLVVAGILVGLAAWTKYTIVLILMGLAPLLLIALLRWRWRLRDVVLFVAPIGTISVLVFAKNWAFTGNPFFPFLSAYFENPLWTQAAADHFHRAVREFEMGGWTWSNFLTFPVHVFIRPRLVDIHPGVVPLILSPVLIFRSMNRELVFLKALIACQILAWLLIHSENRSLLTVFAVLLVVEAIELQRVLERRPVVTWAVVTLIATASLANVGMAMISTHYMTRPIPYFIGIESRDAFLSANAPSQPAFDWLNRDHGVGWVLCVGEHGPYHLKPRAYFSSFSDPPVAEIVTAGASSEAEIRGALASLGVTHIVVDHEIYRQENEAGLYSWSAERKALFEQFIGSCRPVASFGSDTIYALDQGSPPPPVSQSGAVVTPTP